VKRTAFLSTLAFCFIKSYMAKGNNAHKKEVKKPKKEKKK